MTRFPAPQHDLPALPPPEVLELVDLAWERAQDLFASGLELHFALDAPVGDVSAELRSADGSVFERLSASEALAVACGDATPTCALAV